MNTNEEYVHISINARDLACPICFEKYSQSSHQPLTLYCGHTVCSVCLPQMRKCPECRTEIIAQETKQGKDVLVSNIIQLIEDEKKCLAHGASLEIFDRENKRLLCLECILQERYVPRQFFKVAEIKEKAHKISQNLADLDEKLRQDKQNFFTNLDVKKLALNLTIQTQLQNYTEVMKSMLSEIEIMVWTFTEKYQNNPQLHEFLRCLSDQENRLMKWKSAPFPSGEDAEQIMETSFVPVNEENMAKFFTEVQEMHNVLQEKVDFLQLQIVATPQLTKKYYIDSFAEHGLLATWTDSEQGERLTVQPHLTNKTKLFTSPSFNSALDKLTVDCFNLDNEHFISFGSLLYNNTKLSHLHLEMDCYSDVITKILSEILGNLQQLTSSNFSIAPQAKILTITKEPITPIIEALTKIPVLKNLSFNIRQNLPLNLQTDHMIQSQFFEKLEALQTLQLNVHENLLPCLDSLFKAISKSKTINTLNLSIINSDQNAKMFPKNSLGVFCQSLMKLATLKNLKIEIQGFSHSAESQDLTLLALGIGSLRNLETLNISFGNCKNVCLRALYLLCDSIVNCLSKLQEVDLNLNGCIYVNNEILKILGGMELNSANLKTFRLTVKESQISRTGVLQIATCIAKFKSLKTLYCDFGSKIDQNTQNEVTNLIDQNNTLEEQEILYS